MKKILSLIILICCIGIFLSCGNNTGGSKADVKSTSEESVKKDISPAGTYSAVEDGKPMQFILNNDGTGYENYQGTEKRPFKWKSKTEGIFFTYDGENQEWQLPVDIEKGEISYGSLVYKKEEPSNN
jgi:hypothetical protein